MITPDPQRHAIRRIREAQLAVRLLLARHFRGCAFHLHMDPRFHGRAVLRVPTDFRESQ